MKLSVALCTYNGEKFLPEQLASIEAQVLLPDELVVCDDGSTDGTLAILEEFKASAAFPVHIHQNDKNLGSTKNFEKAIGLCRGAIIALCDQDDVWKPHKLERLAETLEVNPDAGYVFSDADLVDEELRPVGCRLWESIGFSGEMKDLFATEEQFKILLLKKIVTGATMAFRAEIGFLAIPFPTKLSWIHDGWLALVATATGARGIPVNDPMIFYRQHERQQIGTRTEAAIIRKPSLLAMYRELKENHRAFFADWDLKCRRVMELQKALQILKQKRDLPELAKNLRLLDAFKIHYLNRHEILTSKDFDRYGLILREAFSGRYAQFSDSWRSMFRDLFL